MDEQIERYAEATAGLMTDHPETRLYLRARAMARAQERVRVHLSAGSDWAESVQGAFYDLGTPERLAAALSAQHDGHVSRQRRQRRVYGILLGMMLLVYAFVQYAGYIRLRHALLLVPYIIQYAAGTALKQYDEGKLADVLSAFLTEPTRRRQAEFLLFGDRTRRSYAERQRAIWEAYPGDPVCFANYTGALLGDGSHSAANLAQFTQEMRRGMQLDPHNAYYHYLLADALAGQALESYDAQTTDETLHGHYRYRVKDRRLLEQAIAELQLAVARHDLHSYRMAMLQARLAMLPAPCQWEDYWLRLLVIGHLECPEQHRYCALTRAIPYIAHLLAAEGRNKEAMALLQDWLPISRQLLGDCNTLNEVLAASSSLDTMSQGVAAVYDELGAHERARQVRVGIAHITEPYTCFRAELSAGEQRTRKLVMQYSALHITPLLWTVGDQYFIVPELEPTRNLEFVILELFIAGMILPTLLCILLLRAAFVGWRWHRTAVETHQRPFTALLPFAAWCHILGWGVLLPLVLYFVYTRWSGLAWREYSLTHSLFLIPVEMIALAVVLLVLPARLTRRAVLQHCTALDVPAPPPGYRRLQGFCSACWAGIWVWVFFCLGVGGTVALISLSLLGKLITTMLIPLLITVLLLASVFIPIWLHRRHPYAQYYGILAKTRIPVYAGTLLLVCLLTLPYLAHSEQYWLREDCLIYTQPGSNELPTPLEQRLAGNLREEMLRNMEQVVSPLSR